MFFEPNPVDTEYIAAERVSDRGPISFDIAYSIKRGAKGSKRCKAMLAIQCAKASDLLRDDIYSYFPINCNSILFDFKCAVSMRVDDFFTFCDLRQAVDQPRFVIYHSPALAKSSAGNTTPYYPQRPRTRTACFFVAEIRLYGGSLFGLASARPFLWAVVVSRIFDPPPFENTTSMGGQ